MMISQFESSQTMTIPGTLPVPQIHSRKGPVSRLVFLNIDDRLISFEDQLETSAVSNKEARLEDETEARNARLKGDEENVLSRLEEARIDARRESDGEWEDRIERTILEERAKVVEIADAFGKEQTRYFVAIEHEVVKLAMAIAARVLHREAKLDPLLLSGVVRVALDRISGDSTTVLHVPSTDLVSWQKAMTEHTRTGNAALNIVGEDTLSPGACFMDTNVGVVELGVEAQLQEIEKGFFDLLQRRPA